MYVCNLGLENLSESCVNNMTIFSVLFFLCHFCFVVVLKRVFVWEVGFKCFPLSVFPAPCHNASCKKAEPPIMSEVV